MSNPLPVEPNAQLKQNIAVSEDKQHTEGIDLSAEIQSLRALLMMLGPPVTTVNQSGGIDAPAERIDIGGDAVGRDKNTTRTETITATDSSGACFRYNYDAGNNMTWSEEILTSTRIITYVTSRLRTSKVDVETTTWYYRFDNNGNSGGAR